MIEMLLAFNIQFISNPVVTPTTQGYYVELVKTDYDLKTNQTYGTFMRYNIDSEKKVRPSFIQSRPFAGRPTKQDMLKTVKSDSYIVTVDLVK